MATLRPHRRSPLRLAAATLMIAFASSGCDRSQNTQPAPTSAPATAPVITGEARTVLESCVRFLQNSPAFSFEATSTSRVTLTDPPESEVRVSVAVQRPVWLAIRVLGGDGTVDVAANGKQIRALAIEGDTYTEQPQEGDIAHLAGTAEVRAALSGGALSFSVAFLKKDVAADLMEGVLSASYAGREEMDGQPAHHLHFVQERFDWDMWIAAEGEPVPLRIEMDRSKAAKPPRAGTKPRPVWMFLQLSNWKFVPDLPAETFDLKVPAGARKVDSLEEKTSPMVGKPPPALRVPRLGGGSLDIAADLGKRVIVVDFWATWCAPCKALLPVLQEVTTAMRDRGVVFYAIDREESPEVVQAFLDAHPELKLTVGLDEKGDVGQRFGVEGIPRTVLIGKDGRVQAVHVGYSPDMRQRLQRELQALVEGKDLATSAPASGPASGPTSAAP